MADLEPLTPPATIAARVQAYAAALALVAMSTLVGLWIAPRWGTAPVDMIYLPAILAAAVLWGLGPALFGGVLAALAYNFFFTEPVHTFRIDRFTDVVTVAVLLVVALVASRLASGVRDQARRADANAARNATIAGFARRLLSSSSEEEIAKAGCAELHRLFGCNAVVVAGLPEPCILAAFPDGNRLTPSDVAAAALTLETGEAAGRGTPRLQPAEWVFHAIRSGTPVIAAAGLARDDGRPAVDDEQLPLLANLLDQLALALARAKAEAERREVTSLRERDRVRSALISAIGNDLRAPIEAIAASVRELRRSREEDREPVAAIGSEVTNLERYVTNLAELGPASDQQLVNAGRVSIDLFRRTVTRDGEAVHLTPKEYLLFAELAKHPGRVLSHEQLLRAAWGPAQENQSEYLRVAIRALRQKLELEPSRPRLIVNEPGVGYRLVVAA